MGRGSKIGGDVKTGNVELDVNLVNNAVRNSIKDIGKEVTTVNKQVLTIKTDDKYILKTADRLNQLAKVSSNFKYKEITDNATLSNLNELRSSVEDLYGSELPRLKSELMDLYSGGLIHPEQYDFFSQKLDQLNSDTFIFALIFKFIFINIIFITYF